MVEGEAATLKKQKMLYFYDDKKGIAQKVITLKGGYAYGVL